MRFLQFFLNCKKRMHDTAGELFGTDASPLRGSHGGFGYLGHRPAGRCPRYPKPPSKRRRRFESLKRVRFAGYIMKWRNYNFLIRYDERRDRDSATGEIFIW